MKAGPAIPGWLAAVVVVLLVGGIGWYAASHWHDKPEFTGNRAMGATMKGPGSQGAPPPGGAKAGGGKDAGAKAKR